MVAVLALYRFGADAFSRDDLSALLALGAKLGLTIEDALQRAGGGAVRVAASGAGGD